MSKKQEENYAQELQAAYDRWAHLYEHGGSDPFWADGYNINLERNHIMYYRRQLEENPTLMGFPEVYYKDLPPEVDSEYMARADEISAAAKVALERYKADENYLYIVKHRDDYTEKTQNKLSIDNVIGYATGLERAIQENRLLDMRRHERSDTCLKAFEECAARMQKTPPEVFQRSMFSYMAEKSTEADGYDPDEDVDGEDYDESETEIETADEREQSFFDILNDPKLLSVEGQLKERQLKRGSGFAGGKFRIYEKYLSKPSAAEFADFLKHEYGTGGYLAGGEGQSHDSKGIEMTLRDKENPENNIAVNLNWMQVAKAIAGLIDNNNYLSEGELEKYEQQRAAKATKEKLIDADAELNTYTVRFNDRGNGKGVPKISTIKSKSTQAARDYIIAEYPEATIVSVELDEGDSAAEFDESDKPQTQTDTEILLQKTEMTEQTSVADKTQDALNPYDNIPDELKSLNQWAVFRTYPDKETGKLKKVIISPVNSHFAHIDLPKTWVSYRQAKAYMEKYHYKGLVFALDNGELTFIDIDHAIKNGEIVSPEAKRLLELLPDTYTEKSVSGTGIHILVKGSLPADAYRRNDEKGVEIYDSRRFICITGDTLNGSREIKDYSDRITDIAYEFTGRRQLRNEYTALPTSQSDTELINRITNSRQGSKFQSLYRGDTAAYASHSHAESALVFTLAWWTQNPAQIDSIVRSSGLMRDKWDSPRGSGTYGSQLISEALSTVIPHQQRQRQQEYC